MTTSTRLVADGAYSVLNVTSAQSLFTGGGTIYRVIVNVSAAAASFVIDSTGTSQSSGNTILTIPASTTAGTVYDIAWPCIAGCALVPGSGVTLAASYAIGNLG